MDLIQAIFLAIIQGLTEFLPVSSSAHLILFSKVIGWDDQGLLFDVALHFGTLLAVLLYFKNDLRKMIEQPIKNPEKDIMQSDLLILIIATIPVVIVGGLFNDLIEENLRSSNIIATTSILFGLLLFVADKIDSGVNQLTLRIGILIGLAQILALIPGVSRSGITITMGLFMGLGRIESAKFSFLLAIPVISGAGLLLALDTQSGITFIPLSSLIVAFMSSFIIGYICLKWLLNLLESGKFHFFGYYCFMIGLIVLVFF